MQKSTFNLPVLRPLKLWAGVYGGHYDIIVLFRTKPTRTEETAKGVVIDCLAEAEADNIAADMSLADFTDWFPGVDLSAILHRDGRPKAIEIPADDLVEMELTLPCDERGRIDTINFHADWR